MPAQDTTISFIIQIGGRERTHIQLNRMEFNTIRSAGSFSAMSVILCKDDMLRENPRLLRQVLEYIVKGDFSITEKTDNQR